MATPGTSLRGLPNINAKLCQQIFLGLFIPDTAKEKPSRGEVVAVGPGKSDESGKRIAMSVKAGDNVLFNKYAGTEIKLDGVEHLVMREDDILAIID